MDATAWVPFDTTAPTPSVGEVLDLTRARFETTEGWGREETPEELGRRYFEQVTKPMAGRLESGAADLSRTGTTGASGMSEEDRLYEAFARESGLNDMTGRKPGTRDGVDLSDLSDAELWTAFVAAVDFEEAEDAADPGAADLSEDGDDGEASPRISDEEAWRQYVEATGGRS